MVMGVVMGLMMVMMMAMTMMMAMLMTMMMAMVIAYEGAAHVFGIALDSARNPFPSSDQIPIPTLFPFSDQRKVAPNII